MARARYETEPQFHSVVEENGIFNKQKEKISGKVLYV
jgi:hypothetical protein